MFGNLFFSKVNRNDISDQWMIDTEVYAMLLNRDLSYQSVCHASDCILTRLECLVAQLIGRTAVKLK